jgi:citrate lyase subunit beta/citryl-CoA lyase
MSGRSYLYVPGDQHAKLERALDLGADALIVDLEDGVAAAAKPAARELVARWLGELTGGEETSGRSPEIWVRINPFGSPEPGAIHADLRAVVAPGLTGICLAKCQSAQEISQLNELLADAERRVGLEPGTVRVSALLESARGLLAAASIATADRVDRLQIGEADLAADLGLSSGPDESELLPLRLLVVVASAAKGIGAPIGPVSTDFRDLDRFRVGTERLKRLGFGARAVIHPAQVLIVNEIFTPTAEEESAARLIVDRFESAKARGEGVIIDDDGRMVDEAVVLAARRILARIEQVG